MPDDVSAWRQARRAALQARRESVAANERDRVGRYLCALIELRVPALDGAVLGLYWPFRGEIDLRQLAHTLDERVADFALPVVVERGRPLQFHRWWPGMRMRRGVLDIPVPAEAEPLQPDLLLVPLLGFDRTGYRLGYGGGYYDRTLAAAGRRPLTLGVGYAFQRLATIHPQPHDVPMDAIATEEGIETFAHSRAELTAQTSTPFSSPCARAELDPGWQGALPAGELHDLLRELLLAERAGARALAELCLPWATGRTRATLARVMRDEGRYAVMLYRHLRRLGGHPPEGEGAFFERMAALDTLGQRLALLERGQGAVVRWLRDALPRIEDASLREDLAEMLEGHRANIDACAALDDMARVAPG